MAPSPLAARFEAAREFFSLRQTEARAAAIPAEKRTSMARSLRLAIQKRDAAETLWLAGLTAEGLRLAREAFVIAHESEPSQAGADAAIAATRKRLDETALPELDTEVGDGHQRLFEEMLAGHDVIARRAAPLALDPRGIARKRLERIVVGALGAVAVVALLWLALRTPKTLRAEASAINSDRFTAANAVDGRNETEWLLPDHAPGWLDVWVGAPRRIKAVKLLNAHIPPYNDRATQDYHLEVFTRGGKLARSIDGSFGAFTDDPKWVTVPLDIADVERVRFEVRSFHKNGGGLAEIEVD